MCVVNKMEFKEQRDIQKKVEIDIVSKNIKLFYLIESQIEIGDIKFTVSTENAMSFNLANEDIGFHENSVLQMEQDTVIEHEKKIVQISKNLKALEELGYTNIELS